MAQPRVAGMDAETFDQAVGRAKAYLQAGADCIHPIVLDDLGTLKRLPEAVQAPINSSLQRVAPRFGNWNRQGSRASAWATA